MTTINTNPNKIGIERYRMPHVEVQILKSNITYIKNLDKIAKAIYRTEEQILKYLAFALGTRTNVLDKSLNGKHEAPALQILINDFIRGYVLCKTCENPETTLNNKKMSCIACGKTNTLTGTSKFDVWLFK